jgi:phosphoribosylanthranilate isomerase
MPTRVIKICGLTNVSDAAAAAEAGATALGFNFYPGSKRFIAPEIAESILGSLPGGILRVGVFVNESAAHVEALVRRLHLDVAQLHGDERADQFPDVPAVWKALRIGSAFQPASLEAFPSAEAFLLDGPAGAEFGGAGVTFPWAVARQCPKRVIIAGGLDASNVAEAIRESGAWGVDACSKLESEPGRKDHLKMIQFVHAARAAEGLA